MIKRKAVDMESDRHWHVEKKIPLALILAILVQSAGFVWFGATLNARVNTLELNAAAAAPQADRLTRVEVQIEVVKEGITEIKRLITAPSAKR